ncbi:MAG: LysM peptidoglycan-binding domain-containing protein [Aquificae bacterium]|nr:LysM peptidoglycan-binding domain-containing protein [Aquificota bacterium]
MKALRYYISGILIGFLLFSLTASALTYTVKRGDNLQKIAKKYGVSVKEIIKANRLKKPYIIRPGQKLKIPVKAKKRSSAKYCSVKHKVKPGESLIKIAKKYRVWVKDIKRLNNLKSDKLYAGQVLCIKEEKKRVVKKKKKSTKTTATTTKRIKQVKKKIVYHRVKRGETLSKIARKYNTSVKKLAKLNRLKKPYRIKAGQRLKVEKKVITYKTVKVAKSKKGTKSSRNSVATASTVPLKFVWPVNGRIVEPFANNSNKRHLGVDIKTDCEVPIKASESGKVIFAGDSIKAYGNLIVIRHQNRFTSVYGHVGKIKVREGEWVKKGEIIGYTGKLNGSEHCGIYFEIRKNGNPVDPVVFLYKKKRSTSIN